MTGIQDWVGSPRQLPLPGYLPGSARPPSSNSPKRNSSAWTPHISADVAGKASKQIVNWVCRLSYASAGHL